MAHDLVKIPRITFSAPVPAIPPMPEIRYRSGGGYWAATYEIVSTYDSAGTVVKTYRMRYVWVDTSVLVVIPARPGVPAIPPTISNDAMRGWNSGGVSASSIMDDGGWRFRVPVATAGAIVGFAPDNTDATPSRITHGLFVSFNEAQVWEGGALGAVFANDGDAITLLRDGGVVTASGTDWTHTFAGQSIGEVVLDAALYVAGDMVADPQAALIGHLAVPTPMPVMRLSDGSGWADVLVPVPMPIPALVGVAGAVGDIAVTTPMPTMRLSDGSGWADMLVPAPMPVPALVGGLPEIAINTLLVPVSMPGMGLVGITGAVGDLRVTTPMPVMRLADEAGWADIAVPVPMPIPTLLSRESKPWSNAVTNTTLRISAARSATRAASSARSVLRRGASANSTSRVLSTAASVLQRSSAAQSGGPVAAGVSTTLLRCAAAPTPITHQLCTNVATGAVSRLTGMQFDGFVTSQLATYGWRHDGVYRLGPTKTPVDVRVDLGVSDLGAAQSKSVPMVIVDVAADAAPQVELAADGRSLRYDTGDIGTGYRASTSKAEAGRDWRITIHAAQVTQFDLQAVEIQFAPLWRKGRAR